MSLRDDPAVLVLVLVSLLFSAPSDALIFADGFETGDTSAWSATVGYLGPIHVSFATGSNITGCGIEPTSPCRTIGFGISEATATGRSHVWVAEGTYVEQVVLFDGLTLRGGFDVIDWTWDPSANLTVVTGNDSFRHPKAVVAVGITDHATLLEGFVIQGENATGWSENSIAVYVVDCGSNLTIRNNVIIAGNGDFGENGFWGLDGTAGANGADGTAAMEPAGAFDCFHDCLVGGGGNPGGFGGSTSCWGTATDGGDGGGSDCPDFDEGTDLCFGCPGSAPLQTVTTSGTAGANGGGAGGLGGCDGLIVDTCTGAGCSCLLPPTNWCPQGMAGSNGSAGMDGQNGSHGAGASDPVGTVFDHEWVGEGGGVGTRGQPGRGSGGGGAGGGVETLFDGVCPSAGYSDLGGSGGGGAAGGCPGDGGGGGFPGGGSFAIFVSFSADPGSDVPAISHNEISRGNGAHGGNGVPGGLGGSGGQGGLGGAGGSTPSVFCAASGGNGGDGGQGGDGGGGGGGAGGISCGICSYGYGIADLSGWMVGTIISSGSGGLGGDGAYTGGGDGVDGALLETNFPVTSR